MLKVAIVGRPNVGKSSLFNRICRGRVSIVAEMEGVTRDRIYHQADVFGVPIEVIDTGGLGAGPFEKQIQMQVAVAVREADAIIMVVDGQVGQTAWDEQVARMLRKQEKPLFLAVNKVDGIEHQEMVWNFCGLGIEHMYGVSALHGGGVGDLLEQVIRVEPAPKVARAEGTRVAIVGRANVGKSTLCNSILGDERCLVSDEPGTTRDAIDTEIQIGERHFTLIDTAGVRKKKSEAEVVEKFASIRTEQAIERADVVVMVVDAREGITASDKRILSLIETKGRPCLLFFNKWDLVKGYRMEHAATGAKMEAHGISHLPMIFGSALTRRNIDEIFDVVEEVKLESTKRISTGELNRFLERVMQLNHPPMIQGRRLRIYYVTQVDTHPPKFSLFVNYPDRLTAAYEKYLLNQMREAYSFKGSPIRLRIVKKKQRQMHFSTT